MVKKIAKQPKLNRLKEVLDDKKLSAYWLAKEMEMAYSQVHGYVNNNHQPSLETLYKIAETLKIDPCSLLAK